MNIVAYSLFSSSPREEETERAGKGMRSRMREKERWKRRIGKPSEVAKRKA